ncbi:MAG TPA: MATE family efflux transporter, partial [Firmicutes bacterium]|nr:MATE family efflux transporter [Bacillota bacterium]
PLLILGLDWGVSGAAIATVIAQSIVLLLFIWFAKRHPLRPFDHFRFLGRIDQQKISRILKWSIPVAVENGAFTALAMVVTGMASAWYGEAAVAVQRVGSQIESMSWLIGIGFSSAITAFVGQNYGARQWGRIRRCYRISLATLLIWEAAVTLILLLGGRFLFSLFLPEPPAILDMGATYLRILAWCQLPAALEGACTGAFRGLGQTLPPSLSSVTANLLRPLLCWCFVQWMGLDGLWAGIALSAALRGIFMGVWYTLYEQRIPLEDEGVGIPSNPQGSFSVKDG